MSAALRNTISAAVYPLIMMGAIAAFLALEASGAALLMATYVPIIVAALLIVGLELALPARLDWRPSKSELAHDAVFMAVVQIALPKLLMAGALIWLAERYRGAQGFSLWPHEWPLLAQMLLMVLLVDLMRYWLHRACHAYVPLWRFHEVHHSPDILYTLNVGRFHPGEKLLHFSLDTLPFLLLGVTPEVLAGYALLYSVNGFFQHSNIDLRYGWLNYVVGSAETHRWHHARDPRTAACNFGNTTIVWDLVFGTWYLPRDKALDIGIMDREYPRGFGAQMLTPFRAKEKKPKRGIERFLADILLRTSLQLTCLQYGRKLRATLRDPAAAQRKLLEKILRHNRASDFGLRHDFSAMRTYEDYRDRLAVQDYESLRADIQIEIEDGKSVLTVAPPIRYVRTSGTTGQPKDIPLTRTHLDALQIIQRRSLAFQQRLCPEAFEGSILALSSPAVEGYLANGKSYGAASGILVGSSPAAMREKFAVPHQVFEIEESFLKYMLILRLALAREDLSYLGSANPSTLLTLIRIYREHRQSLIQDVRSGGFHLLEKLPPKVLKAVRKRLQANPARATQLEQLPDPVRIGDLWPRLRALVTWTCASAGIAAQRVKAELGPQTLMIELGYISSEFRGTITLGRRRGSGLPTVDTHFFEFVERGAWDNGRPEFLLVDQLRKGDDYYVFVTTPSGLYRYFINDLVRVSAHLRRMPLLHFLQKGKGVTSITGEKIYEAQALQAIESANKAHAVAASFFLLAADEAASRYDLYLESHPGHRPALLAHAVDSALQILNIEYAAKRESERLGALRLVWLRPGCAEAFKARAIAQGQREGQFKPPALSYKKSLDFDFEAWAESADAH